LDSLIAMRLPIAIAAWLLLGAEALAQPPSPAEEAFEKGRLLTEAARHAQACAAFELSQRLDPQFGTLYNLAECYVNTGKIATAWRLYRELSLSDSNAERRSSSAELATKLEPRVSKVRVRVPVEQQSSDLRVFVGTTEVTSLLDVEIPFDAGRYVVFAVRTGYPLFRREIDLKSEQVSSVDVVLERKPVSNSVESEPSASGIKAKITLGAGVGLLGFAAFAGWRWYVNKNAGDLGSSASADRAAHWGLISRISLMCGLGTSVVGSALLFKSSESRPVRVAPAVGSGSASLVVSGVF